MAIKIKTKEELELMREGGRYLAHILRVLASSVRPEVRAHTLDELAEKLIFDCGGEPAFKGYHIQGVAAAFPSTICTSVNDEVVHAFPLATKVLKEGDIVAIDIGMKWPATTGLYTDMAVTVGVGTMLPDATRLINATREALMRGIAAVRLGAYVGDVSHAVGSYLTGEGLGIVRDLAGHGVGYALHEDPLIPNYGKPGTGAELREGMAIAIEPIVTLGSPAIRLMPDEWTFKTKDGSLAAHFEHTIMITANGAEMVTKE